MLLQRFLPSDLVLRPSEKHHRQCDSPVYRMSAHEGLRTFLSVMVSPSSRQPKTSCRAHYLSLTARSHNPVASVLCALLPPAFWYSPIVQAAANPSFACCLRAAHPRDLIFLCCSLCVSLPCRPRGPCCPELPDRPVYHLTDPSHRGTIILCMFVMEILTF